MRIPQNLHKPIQVLWWDADEFSILFIFLVGALIFWWGFFIPMIVVPHLYGRVKKRYPRGFLRHSLYFAGIRDFNIYPSYLEKEFSE